MSNNENFEELKTEEEEIKRRNNTSEKKPEKRRIRKESPPPLRPYGKKPWRTILTVFYSFTFFLISERKI